VLILNLGVLNTPEHPLCAPMTGERNISPKITSRHCDTHARTCIAVIIVFLFININILKYKTTNYYFKYNLKYNPKYNLFFRNLEFWKCHITYDGIFFNNNY
jgi:hypothetical protein